MNELALFAGAGGGILGGRLLGWRTVCAVERDAYAAFVLAQRQTDGCLEAFPIWSDIESFDGRPWQGIIDVVSGGFPCQDVSCAGKGKGIAGKRSGLWKEMHRVVCDTRPNYVLVENTPMLTSRGLGVVLGDLAASGYDCEWHCLSAAQCGAPHKRDRIWVLATNTDLQSRTAQQEGEYQRAKEFIRRGQRPVGSPVATQPSRLQQGNPDSDNKRDNSTEAIYSSWWQAEPCVDRVVDGLAFRVDRLKAIGNGQVPAVVEQAWTNVNPNQEKTWPTYA